MYKVLHVNDSWEGGGAEAVFRDTIRVSQELGFKNEIYTSEGKRNIFTYIYSFAEYSGFKNKILFFKPDVIHIHNYYHYLSPAILMVIKRLRDKKIWNGRVVFTAHDYHLICPNSGLQYYKGIASYNFSIDKKNFTYYCKFDRRGYLFSNLKLLQHLLCYKLLKLNKVIDKIISPSLFLKKVFKNWGVDSDIIVVRNPIIESTQKSMVVRQQSNCIKLVFMGRVSEEKGLLKFIDKIKNSKFNIDFHIYGTGDQVKHINNLNLRSGINIIFHGHISRDKLLDEISGYDIFVLPSIWYENAPLSILEAANLGLPVIVPNYGGLKEIASLTKTYFTFDYLNNNIDDCLFSAMKEVNKNYIINPDEFTYDTYKKNILNIYLN